MAIPDPHAAGPGQSEEQRRRLYRDLREQATRRDSQRLQRVRQLLARDAAALRRNAGRQEPAGFRRSRG